MVSSISLSWGDLEDLLIGCPAPGRLTILGVPIGGIGLDGGNGGLPLGGIPLPGGPVGRLVFLLKSASFILFLNTIAKIIKIIRTARETIQGVKELPSSVDVLGTQQTSDGSEQISGDWVSSSLHEE
jgi:hypothetical protein